MRGHRRSPTTNNNSGYGCSSRPHVQRISEDERSRDGIVRLFVERKHVSQTFLEVLRLDPLLPHARLRPPTAALALPVCGKVYAKRITELAHCTSSGTRVRLWQPADLPASDRMPQLEEQPPLLAVEIELLRRRARRQVVHKVVQKWRQHHQRDQPPTQWR